MEAPTRKHKPIVSVDDYDQIDGQYANDTDAMALSLGWAQYNKPELPHDQKELSLKVWRKGDGGWSRMSEELPIHRNLDLSKLFLEALIEGCKQEDGFVSENQKLHLHENNGDYEDIIKYYKENQAFLAPRLNDLRRLLEKWSRITSQRIDFISLSDFDESDEDYQEEYEDIEGYSPTSWDRFSDETDEEYQERMDDQESLLEYYDE